jgi:hypothetical protein
MDKRLVKRHKREVARARAKVKLSEPDVRTPEQVAAAKALSRPDLRRESHPWPTLPSDTAVTDDAGGSQPAPAASSAKP